MDPPKKAFVPGSLDMLILKTLTGGPLHGYGIAQHVKAHSREVLQIDEGTLYPALQRLRQRGWVAAEWKKTPNSQRARPYTITAAGRRELGLQEATFAEQLAAIQRVLRSV